jgi:UDP-glucose 4-epimerase
MTILNIAVWGLGSHAKNRILPLLSIMDKIKMVGVCSRDSEMVKICAEQWSCYGWNDPLQMLNSNEVDVVYIATPIGTHFSLARQAIEAGKHVWCEKPLTCSYYDTNVGGTFILAEVMREFGCKMFVFSSSATVYGNPYTLPIKEDFPLSATNPYGRSKLMIEEFLQDVFTSDDSWRVALLRYFNPVGAHESGLIGEDPNNIPNNLIPYISQVAVGKLEKLSVFGGDYDTPDGTGVRDYIHVVDLAKGHVKALQVLKNKPQVLTVNLGTGNGYSVLDMVKAFEQASGKNVPYQIMDRRSGDIATCYADPSYALKALGWKAERGLGDMCKDTWRWQSMNPNGYEKNNA